MFLFVLHKKTPLVVNSASLGCIPFFFLVLLDSEADMGILRGTNLNVVRLG